MAIIALVACLICAPASAIEFGCFVNAYECGGIATWPETVKQMRAAGMTTGVIFVRSIPDLTFQVDTMLEGGMLPPGVPLLVIMETPERREPVTPAISGWAVGEMEGQVAALRKGRVASKLADRWPEVIPYGPDEPGHGVPGADVSGAKLVADAWRSLGFRCGTAVEGANLVDCIPFLDLVAVAAEDGYPTARDVAALKAAGKHFWVYDSALPQRKPWTLGVQMTRWCAWKPEVFLFWSWGRLTAHPVGYQDQWLWAFREAAEEINRVQNYILPGVPR